MTKIERASTPWIRAIRVSDTAEIAGFACTCVIFTTSSGSIITFVEALSNSLSAITRSYCLASPTSRLHVILPESGFVQAIFTASPL